MKKANISVYIGSLQAQMLIFFPTLLLLCLGLLIFFIIRLLIITVDYTALILIAFFAVAPVFILLASRKHQLFSRYTLRYQFSEQSIFFHGFGWKSWTISWDELTAYCLTDMERSGVIPYVVLATDYDGDISKDAYIIQKNRIVIQADKKHLSKVMCFFPEDVRENIEKCLDEQRNGFFRRKR